MRFDRRRPLTAAQQYLHLNRNPICAGKGELRAGCLIWRYETTPFSLSREYGVRIEFQQGHTPKVFVETPDLHALAGERRLPHVYEQSPIRLCLYLPRTFEWQSWMRIDETMVPWATLWLFYFEEWLSSNEWKGGGEHPGSPPRADRDSSYNDIAR